MHKLGLKIILGYLILTATLCAAVWFIVKSARTVTGVSQTEQTIATQRRAADKLLINLIDMGTLGESATLKYADNTSVKRFIDGVQMTDSALVQMKKLTRDKSQHARLDSLSSLIRLKREGILNLIGTLRAENQKSDGLQQQIAALRSGETPIEVDTHIPVPIYNNEEEIIIQRRKKGFFRRLGDAFRKAKDDTLQVSKSVREVSRDTTQANVNLSDTIARILTDVQNDIRTQKRTRARRVTYRSDRLRASGAELSRRIALLMEDIAAEQQQQLFKASEREHEERTRAAWQIGFWALITTLIAAVLFVWVWRDMSRAHRYRKELEKAKQRAEDLMERREQLLLTISHDIKAPVNTILGYLSLLQPSSTEVPELEAINASAHHLLNLVTDLLDYHKLEAGGIVPHNGPVNLYRLLHQIATAYVPSIQAKGLQFCEELSPSIETTIQTDEFRFRQIVENLFSNAVKYTTQGKITLSGELQGNRLTISLRDTGCGLCENDLENICRPFARFKGSEGQEGTGLGLSITRQLVTLLKGEMIIDSELGKGSVFTLHFNISPCCAPIHEGNESLDQTPLSSPSSNLTLAILDDDLLQLRLTEAMLRNVLPTGTEIKTFHQSDELFGWLTTGNRPSLLFTDIEMPGLTGYDILERVRRISGMHLLQVIATTSHSLVNAEHFLHRGFSDVIFKPFTQNDLRITLEKLGFLSQSVPLPLESTEEKAAETTHDLHQSFKPLLSFAEGDEDAENAILLQFSKDCEIHRSLLISAERTHDKASLCRIAHKMLPTFTLLGSSSVSDLRSLEDRRTETNWTDNDTSCCQRIIDTLENLLAELHQLIRK